MRYSAITENKASTVLVCVLAAFPKILFQQAAAQNATTFPSTTTRFPLDPTEPPDVCRARATFTLPNGRIVDNSAKFCNCEYNRWNAQMQIIESNGTLNDFIPAVCHSDGTWHCRQQANIVACIDQYGGTTIVSFDTDCSVGAYCQAACLRYGTGSNGITGFQNIGNCSCSTVFNQQIDKKVTAADNFVPQCNGDGTWKATQSGYNAAWTVDSSGNPDSAMNFTTSGAY